MDTCEQIRELLSAQLDGELAPGDAERIEPHLDSCAECRRISEAWRRADLAIAGVGRRIAPGASVREAVLDRVRRERTMIPWPAWATTPWVRWAAAACLVLVGALIARIALQDHDGGRPGPVAAARTHGRDRDHLPMDEAGPESGIESVDAKAALPPARAGAASSASTALRMGTERTRSFEGLERAGGGEIHRDMADFHADTGFAPTSTAPGLGGVTLQESNGTAILARKSRPEGASTLGYERVQIDRVAGVGDARRSAAEMSEPDASARGPGVADPSESKPLADGPPASARESVAALSVAALSDDATDLPAEIRTVLDGSEIREETGARGDEAAEYARRAAERGERYGTMGLDPEKDDFAGAVTAWDEGDDAGRSDRVKERHSLFYYADARPGCGTSRARAGYEKAKGLAVGQMRFVALDPADAVRVGQRVARRLQGDLVQVNGPQYPAMMLTMNRLVLPEDNLDAFVGEMDSLDVRIVDLRDPPDGGDDDGEVDADGVAAGYWYWAMDECADRAAPAIVAAAPLALATVVDSVVADPGVADDLPAAGVASELAVEEPVERARFRSYASPAEATPAANWTAGGRTPALVRFDVEIASPRFIPGTESAGVPASIGGENR